MSPQEITTIAAAIVSVIGAATSFVHALKAKAAAKAAVSRQETGHGS